MDLAIILAIIFIIIVVFIILGFVVWYRGQKTPSEYSEFPEEEYYEGYVEREFRCPNCGVRVEPDEIICHECGAEFREGEYECPKCGQLVDPNELECPHCGEVFELEPNICPNCGKVVAADATQCPKCKEEFWSPLRLPTEEEDKLLPTELPGMEEGVEEETAGEGEEGKTD